MKDYFITDIDYNLPEELIALEPLPERDKSNLMVIDRNKRTIEIDKFYNILNYLPENSGIVFNATKVFKARLWGITEKNKRIEILLTEKIDDKKWKCLVRNSRKFKNGTVIYFNTIRAILGNVIDNDMRMIEFDKVLSYEEINEMGSIPLPPYIVKGRETKKIDAYKKEDDERYQTVFGKYYGSVASPTASLHWTPELLNRLKDKNIKSAEVILHIGPGTFKQIKDINTYRIHEEWIEVNEITADFINEIKNNNSKLIAVGTTALRAIESLKRENGLVIPYKGKTDLFIKPGYNFKYVDILITNFHMPNSSLLLLVEAFADVDLIKRAYNLAIEKKFRFLSYGDCMVIL